MPLLIPLLCRCEISGALHCLAQLGLYTAGWLADEIHHESLISKFSVITGCGPKYLSDFSRGIRIYEKVVPKTIQASP